MKFLLVSLLVSQLSAVIVEAYIPIVCSTHGGVCKIDDINQFANKFMDKASNYVHEGYMAYCRYICSLVQYVFGTWVNPSEATKPLSFLKQIEVNYLNPLLIWLGLVKEPTDSIEDLVCHSSLPILVIIVSFGLYAITVYIRSKKKDELLTTKFDISAYHFEDGDEVHSESTFTTLFDPCERKSCCGCRKSFSDFTETSE